MSDCMQLRNIAQHLMASAVPLKVSIATNTIDAITARSSQVVHTI